MSDFHEVKLPLRLALGAQGGPERRTEIITLASGREVRNQQWINSRRRWEIGSGLKDLASLQDLISFFEARQGRLFGFRFQDPMDHASAPAGQTLAATDQWLGTGDDATTQYQLIKTYGGATRKICKPVAGTVRIALDGSEIETGWQLDARTGQIEFTTPPDFGVSVTAGFEFDCAVRFEHDQMTGVLEAFQAGRIVSLGLVELL